MTPRRVLSTIALALFVVLAVIELLTQDSPSWLLVIAAFSAGCCLMALLDEPH
jgi:hypothetical protein